MKQFLFLLISLFSISITAQLDWDAYKDPGGDFYRIILDPNVSFSYDDSDFTSIVERSFLARLGATFNVDIVRERSLLNVNATMTPVFDYIKPKNVASGESDFTFGQNIFAEYTYYFKERRGFHVQPNISLNNRFGDENYLNTNRVGVNFGYGRLENISTVYQSLRIQKQNNNSGEALVDMSQDQLFQLADVIRQLDFNQKLDSRYRNIDNQSIFLENAEDLGFVLNDFFSIANMIDAYRFERSASNVAQGNLYQIGFTQTWSDFGGLEGQNLTGRAILARAMNQNWHVQHNFSFQYDLDSDYNIMYSNRFTYVPIGRTQISFGGNASYRKFAPLEGAFNFSAFSTMNYFVSPQVSLTGNMNLSLLNLGEDFAQNRLNFFFGIRYFAI
ncbi:MAG: hypothetical protein HKN09_01435 [Saprospiraceae bacterium]|nr:hypothetical protein [Saprospiraceae bacterium]